MLALAWAAPLKGQSVKLPEKVEVAVGRLAAVKIEIDGDDFKYATPMDLDCFREYDPDPKVIRLRLIGYAPGKHQLYAVACKGGKLSEFAVCTVIVGGVPPVPPGPTPPPVPPVPPVDPLVSDLLTAFNVDQSTNQATAAHLSTLTEMYRQGADMVLKDTSSRTVGDFYTRTRQAFINAVPADKLTNVRSILAMELDKALPIEPGKVLDDAAKRLIAEKFKWAASVLSQVKVKGLHDGH